MATRIVSGELANPHQDILLSAIIFSERYGCANGWTGTLGTAATIIHELLRRLEEQGDEQLAHVRRQWESGEHETFLSRGGAVGSSPGS